MAALVFLLFRFMAWGGAQSAHLSFGKPVAIQ